MKSRSLFAIIGLASSLLPVAVGASGGVPPTYRYKKNKYVTVTAGMAPNKIHSIVAHGGGEDGYENFHVYLMAEPDFVFDTTQFPASGEQPKIGQGVLH